MKRRKKSASRLFYRLVLISFLGGTAYLSWFQYARTHPKVVEIGELPDGFRSHGIDVSHYQGEIDWEEVFASTDSIISFVYCKATEGTHFVDEHWLRNRSALNGQKWRNGAYHFFSPNVSGAVQATHFLNHYDHLPTDMPPVLDAEVEGESDAKLISGMHEWLKIVEAKTKLKPIIYTSYHLYSTKFKTKFEGYVFWIASYNPDQSRVDDSSIKFWQYSDKGKIPGIDALVDLNFAKELYETRKTLLR